MSRVRHGSRHNRCLRRGFVLQSRTGRVFRRRETFGVALRLDHEAFALFRVEVSEACLPLLQSSARSSRVLSVYASDPNLAVKASQLEALVVESRLRSARRSTMGRGPDAATTARRRSGHRRCRRWRIATSSRSHHVGRFVISLDIGRFSLDPYDSRDKGEVVLATIVPVFVRLLLSQLALAQLVR